MEESKEKVIQKLLDYVETAEGFASEQAPLVVEEILRSAWLPLSVIVLVWVIFAILWLKVVRRLIAAIKENSKKDFRHQDHDLKFGGIAFIVLYSVGASALIGFSLYTFMDIVQSIFTPRLYILEQLRSML